MSQSNASTTQTLRGTVTVADTEYLFIILKGLYRLASEAFRELVTNGIEAGSTALTITFFDEKGKSFIEVEDNGWGITQKQLYDVGVKICESIKRGKKDLTGRHGIGLPSSAKRLGGERILVVSKALNQTDCFALDFPLIGAQIDFTVDPDNKHPIQGHGTRVYILNLGEEQRVEIERIMAVRKDRGASPLCDFLARAFCAEILNKNVKIRLEVRGRKSSDEFVNPPVFGGVPIPLDSIKTQFGFIEFDLRCKPPRSAETVAIQHHIGCIVADITDLADFREGSWRNFAGFIKAPWLERSGGGVALDHKTYLVFRSILKRDIEPKLTSFHRQVAEEQVDANEVHRLRAAFRDALGGESLSLKNMQMPPTHVISPEGEVGDFVRSTLDRHPGTITERGAGRLPYASPLLGAATSSLTPIPRTVKTQQVLTQKVGSLQWRLMAFSPEKQHLHYEVVGGQILINTANANYTKFIDPENYKRKGLTRMTLKLLWMARITCQVIVEWNFPVKEYEEMDRQMQFGLLFSRVCVLLLK